VEEDAGSVRRGDAEKEKRVRSDLNLRVPASPCLRVFTSSLTLVLLLTESLPELLRAEGSDAVQTEAEDDAVLFAQA